MKSKSVYCVCAVLLMQYTLTAQVILSATKAEFILGVTDDVKNANIHGVYPVKLKWNDAGKKYDVYRAGLETGEFTLISKDVSGGEYTDINDSAEPEQFFYYKVKSGMEESNVDEGYGALSQDVYMNVYNKNIVSSHSKLTLMFKRIALQKLGKESAQGTLTGSLSYHAKIKGFHGEVIIRYDNYSDDKLWILEGNTNIRANIFANGKMYGTVECAGCYPGKVSYDDIIIRFGSAAKGSYKVEPAGFPPADVGWDMLLPEDTGVTDREFAETDGGTNAEF